MACTTLMHCLSQNLHKKLLPQSQPIPTLFGFTTSALFIGNYQEANGTKSGWGAVILAEAVALVAASTVHRVCITTCLLFSVGLLYEINRLSVMMAAKGESKTKRF
ncbi:unnamed protein product [Cuscuta europaea]|uniref:Dolichyl-diphosphooligosaccharide--protein glycosyltransferase subunit KCP2 n=1 Tax=Cuscuta europaea TaxID=41803 RepID=A0A9P0Z1J1_CUSEU|nr:unnamed protein product [Cuscuta europaea]